MRLNWNYWKRFRFDRTAKTVLVAFLLLQMPVLLALAACPSLHQALHHDSNSSEHHCAVTMFAHGQVDSAVVEVAAILPVTPVEFSPLTLVSIPNAPAATLPPGRGPPASLLHS